MKIKLTKNKFALIDHEDFKKVNQYKWYFNPTKYGGYALSRKEGKHLHMHRLITDCPNGFDVDHINKNTLDNRKQNLRVCTRSQNNIAASVQSNNTSGFKGVSWIKDTGKWRAYIKNNRKQIFLGCYFNIKEAAQAYNQAAIKYFGEYARLNEL